MLTGKELDLLGEAYQRRSEEISRKISAEFPEFSRMDVLYVRNFIQENGIPLETAIKNLKATPKWYIDRLKYLDKLGSCYFAYDKELEVVKRLLKNFDKEEVLEYVRESLRRNKPLWKVVRDQRNKFDEQTVEYLSAEY